MGQCEIIWICCKSRNSIISEKLRITEKSYILLVLNLKHLFYKID